jgi:GPI mannosyltransferase 2
MHSPKRTLVLYSILARAGLIILLLVSAKLGQDDESPALHKSRLSPLLRWDAFHFTQDAVKGYAFEHQWAFQPTLPFLLQTLGIPLTRYFGVTPMTAVLAPAFLVPFISTYTTVLLYDLSLTISSSPNFAFCASLLSIFPPSPVVTHFSICNEPFFNLFSYAGMLYASRNNWMLSSLCLMSATAFRTNGILLAGFPIWGILVRPFAANKKVRDAFNIGQLLTSH